MQESGRAGVSELIWGPGNWFSSHSQDKECGLSCEGRCGTALNWGQVCMS